MATGNLRFREDGSLTIVQFTDLHWQNGDAADRQTARLMGDVLDGANPDLVVLTGDVIQGEDCRDPLASWSNAVAPIIARDLPWAAVFGNHDDEGSATREQLMVHQLSLARCLSRRGPNSISGVGNFALPIDAANRSGGVTEPAAVLFFLDSLAYSDRAKKEYAWIQQDQIDWFTQSAAEYRLPSLVFFHIPLPEYNVAWETGQCEGSKHENVCCPKFNSGLFEAMKSSGNVMGAFVGHDHVNDFAGELAGIRLCYGRATGFNTYGRHGFARGARIITIREGRRTFTTEIVTDRE